MKRKLILASMLAALCFAAAPVYAANEIKVDVNNDTYEIKVTGDLGNSCSNKRIILYCVPEGVLMDLQETSNMQSDTDVFKIFRQSMSDETGYFSFDNLRIDPSEASNNYVFYLTIENSDIVLNSDIISISSAQDINNFINSISNKSGNDILSALNAVKDNRNITVDLYLYNMLNTSGKTEVSKRLEYKEYLKISSIENDISAACADVGLYSMDTAANIDKLLYPDEYEDMTLYTSIINDNNGFAQYSTTNPEETKVLNRLEKSQRNLIYNRVIKLNPSSKDDFYESLSFSVMMYEIENVTGYGDITSILKKYKDSILKDMNYSKYESSGRIDVINKAIMGRTFSSAADLCKFVNDELNTDTNTSGGSGGSGGAGGSGSSGSSSGSKRGVGGISAGGSYAWSDVNPNTTVVNNQPASSAVFSDIEEYDWAKTSIIELYGKGIISGTGDGLFEPDRKVTREEFLKMLLLAKGYDVTSGSCEYNDVDTDEWYAPYIFTSLDIGIANGISDERFGIGESITRQDAAVLIWRAANQPDTEFECDFTDKGDISDYAVAAVNWMEDKSFISGYDDKSFKPKNGISRAEAAKIIFMLTQKAD